MSVPEIFDRNARRLRRGRVSGGGFFAETMARDLLERLDGVTRRFARAGVIGAEPLLLAGLAQRGIAYDAYDPSPLRASNAVEEDRFDAAAASYDLILAAGTLDTVADLPGALLLMRRALKPDGLLLGNFASAPGLAALRNAIAAADATTGLAVARLHPQIEVRAAGDLLVRAGFALPMADLDTLDVSYASVTTLLSDLRDAAATNVLAQRYPVSRAWLAALHTAFAAQADATGRTHETLSYITLTGWAPAPDQPQPARRGSATAALRDAITQTPR